MDKLRFGITQLRRAWLTKEDVINTLDAEMFLKSLRPRPTAMRAYSDMAEMKLDGGDR